MLIEESKDSYYKELHNSGENWHTGDNRFKLIGKEKLRFPERVFSVVQKSLEPVSKKDIMILCPDIS